MRLCFAVIALFLSFHLSAQYRKAEHYLSAKVSFADYSDQNDWSGYSVSKIPPVAVSYEIGGTNLLSYGAFVGFNKDSYQNDTLKSDKYMYSNFGIGLLGSLHLVRVIEELSNYSLWLNDWDFYVSASILMIYNRYEFSEFETKYDVKTRIRDDVNFRLRPVFGVRYNISNQLSMLMEVGKGNMGTFTTGLTWRFN